MFVPDRDGRVSPRHDPLTPPPGQGRGCETQQIATITLSETETCKQEICILFTPSKFLLSASIADNSDIFSRRKAVVEGIPGTYSRRVNIWTLEA